MVFKNFLCRGQEMKVRNDSNRKKLQPRSAESKNFGEIHKQDNI